MKNLNYLFFSIMILLIALSGCSNNDQAKMFNNQKPSDSEKNVELTVSAAASLQDALNDIKDSFQNEHPNVIINYNFGASGALQQQISQGAPVDLFFSAAEDKFDKLVQDGLIEKENGKDLLGNELVLVVPIGSSKSKGIKSFEDLTKSDKLSLGTPEAVPAGQYAKETLENMNVWKAVEGKVVYAKDVRQVLTYVESQNVDAGIVYKTDALISKKVKIAASAKENTHDPIVYSVGVIKTSTHPKEAQIFYDYLQNDHSLKTFTKYGFKGLD
ncbi:molybdate ABC transporter substrate-binding protein [Neobacillus cucumis]|uniref:molybdate ABC transporter substrate-binding protein n=1 Tax=Neobacillus cucumis TaxID=1740721 RepID=UPI00203F24C2|nr:molybdate ABC transporter substrate-binding protein [Neobacillus cucumis]MCM3724821.1 molybdate ABC transporter substrate-binding protein [Neobacillus cucumis]